MARPRVANWLISLALVYQQIFQHRTARIKQLCSKVRSLFGHFMAKLAKILYTAAGLFGEIFFIRSESGKKSSNRKKDFVLKSPVTFAEGLQI
jgi:hypothetical protein